MKNDSFDAHSGAGGAGPSGAGTSQRADDRDTDRRLDRLEFRMTRLEIGLDQANKKLDEIVKMLAK